MKTPTNYTLVVITNQPKDEILPALNALLDNDPPQQIIAASLDYVCSKLPKVITADQILSHLAQFYLPRITNPNFQLYYRHVTYVLWESIRIDHFGKLLPIIQKIKTLIEYDNVIIYCPHTHKKTIRALVRQCGINAKVKNLRDKAAL